MPMPEFGAKVTIDASGVPAGVQVLERGLGQATKSINTFQQQVSSSASVQALDRNLGQMTQRVQAFQSKVAQIQKIEPMRWIFLGMDAQMLAMFSGAVSAAMLGAAGAAAKLSIDFEASMRDVNSMIHLSEGNFQSLSKQVMDLDRSMDVTQGPTELAKGLYFIYSSGQAGAQALTTLKQSAEAAVAGITDVATAATVIVGAMNAFSSTSLTAQQAADVMFKTVELGVLRFDDLAQGMGQVMPVAAAMGVSFEEVGAALASITRGGVVPAEAFTALTRTLTSILNPSAEAAKTAKEIGLQWNVAAVQAKGLIGVLQDMVEKTHGNVEVMVNLIGEQRALKGALTLVRDGAQDYISVLAQEKRAMLEGGSAAAAQADQMESAKNKLALFTKQVDLFGIAAGNSLLPWIGKAAAAAAELLKQLEPLGGAGALAAVGIGAVAGGIAIFLTSVAQALFAFGTIKNFIQTLGPQIVKTAFSVDSMSAALVVLSNSLKEGGGATAIETEANVAAIGPLTMLGNEFGIAAEKATLYTGAVSGAAKATMGLTGAAAATAGVGAVPRAGGVVPPVLFAGPVTPISPQTVDITARNQARLSSLLAKSEEDISKWKTEVLIAGNAVAQNAPNAQLVANVEKANVGLNAAMVRRQSIMGLLTGMAQNIVMTPGTAATVVDPMVQQMVRSQATRLQQLAKETATMTLTAVGAGVAGLQARSVETGRFVAAPSVAKTMAAEVGTAATAAAATAVKTLTAEELLLAPSALATAEAMKKTALETANATRSMNVFGGIMKATLWGTVAFMAAEGIQALEDYIIKTNLAGRSTEDLGNIFNEFQKKPGQRPWWMDIPGVEHDFGGAATKKLLGQTEEGEAAIGRAADLRTEKLAEMAKQVPTVTAQLERMKQVGQELGDLDMTKRAEEGLARISQLGPEAIMQPILQQISGGDRRIIQKQIDTLEEGLKTATGTAREILEKQLSELQTKIGEIDLKPKITFSLDIEKPLADADKALSVFNDRLGNFGARGVVRLQIDAGAAESDILDLIKLIDLMDDKTKAAVGGEARAVQTAVSEMRDAMANVADQPLVAEKSVNKALASLAQLDAAIKKLPPGARLTLFGDFRTLFEEVDRTKKVLEDRKIGIPVVADVKMDEILKSIDDVQRVFDQRKITVPVGTGPPKVSFPEGPEALPFIQPSTLIEDFRSSVEDLKAKIKIGAEIDWPHVMEEEGAMLTKVQQFAASQGIRVPVTLDWVTGPAIKQAESEKSRLEAELSQVSKPIKLDMTKIESDLRANERGQLGWRQEIAKAEQGLKTYEDAVKAADKALQGLNRQNQDLGRVLTLANDAVSAVKDQISELKDQISEANQTIQDFSAPSLVGMRELEMQITAIGAAAADMQIKIAQAGEAFIGPIREATKAGLEFQLQLADLSSPFDAQLSALDKAILEAELKVETGVSKINDSIHFDFAEAMRTTEKTGVPILKQFLDLQRKKKDKEDDKTPEEKNLEALQKQKSVLDKRKELALFDVKAQYDASQRTEQTLGLRKQVAEFDYQTQLDILNRQSQIKDLEKTSRFSVDLLALKQFAEALKGPEVTAAEAMSKMQAAAAELIPLNQQLAIANALLVDREKVVKDLKVLQDDLNKQIRTAEDIKTAAEDALTVAKLPLDKLNQQLAALKIDADALNISKSLLQMDLDTLETSYNTRIKGLEATIAYLEDQKRKAASNMPPSGIIGPIMSSDPAVWLDSFARLEQMANKYFADNKLSIETEVRLSDAEIEKIKQKDIFTKSLGVIVALEVAPENATKKVGEWIGAAKNALIQGFTNLLMPTVIVQVDWSIAAPPKLEFFATVNTDEVKAAIEEFRRKTTTGVAPPKPESNPGFYGYNYPQTGSGFATGGTVPGPPGAPQWAVVHGGERFMGSTGPSYNESWNVNVVNNHPQGDVVRMMRRSATMYRLTRGR